MRIFCKVDGRDGIIVGAGADFRKEKGEWIPSAKLMVILAGERFIQLVGYHEAEIYGAPKKLRKLHKKLLRRSESAVE